MRRLVLLLFTAALVAGCGSQSGSVSELRGIDDLKEQFNEDAGEPRLILLLSPS